MALLQSIKDILIYKGPKIYNTFELLEEDNEGNGQNQATGKKTKEGGGHKVGAPDTSKDGTKAVSRKKYPELVKGTPIGKVRQKKDDEKKPQKTTDNVDKQLDVNMDRIKAMLNFPTNVDVVIREFRILQKGDAFILYIDGMANGDTINDFILRPLLSETKSGENNKTDNIDYVVENLLSVNQISLETRYSQIIPKVLNGFTALFIDKSEQCVVIETPGFAKRSVTEPKTESVVFGPHEAFIEDLKTNITLVHRIIRSKDLITEILPVGKKFITNVAIMYINGVTNPKIVNEVKRRIESIDADYVLNTALPHLIEDDPYALLPQILHSERPDRTASFLLEGQVAIIADGAPYSHIVPVTFFHMFHTSEDHSLRWQYGTFLRIIRVIAIALATLLPGLYLAVTLFHHEMVPTELLVTLVKARENLPFPATVEILLMEFSWELIREAGIRVPGIVGQTLGIIGAVILGQAAVQAGLVSPILIIIIALTGLGNFAIPNISLAFGIRILRFAFLFLGATAGFYGIAIGVFILSGLACSTKSFGVPYFSPTAPKTGSSTDLVLRLPTFAQKSRPDPINPVDIGTSKGPVRGWLKQNNEENGGGGND